ncbi:MAG: hypothetical protein HXY46_09200 [Syntrophaceae bacterium]|nr:hypothetical protein [Syntrophaceae bacterium]
MDFKAVLCRFSIFLLLFILSFAFACSTPSWFPIKKGPPHRAKMKELLDKEVIIVDGEEYVKVLNPEASEGRERPKYLYLPVEEYLSKRGSFTTSAIRKEEATKGFPVTPMKSALAETEREVSVSSVIRPFRELKKRVVIAHFDDRTNHSDEVFGDWVAERLINQIGRRSQRLLFVDYQTVHDFLKKNGIALKDLETPPVLRSIHEVFGIQALVVGELSGPYLFATKGAKDQEETAFAIIKVETRVVDASSGKVLKTFSSSNPIHATKEKGTFSEEKAKMKAIDLAISTLGQSLAKELEGLDWFCRVAKVEGEEVYINAGRLTGLKVGDVMEVLRPTKPGEEPGVKARVRIGGWFGIDGSIGKLIEGERPEANDILKIARTFSDTESGK